MGFFSFLTADTHESIKIGSDRTVYLLVPKEFQQVYGKHIPERWYQGYGGFGGIDIYEFLADMIIKANADPERVFAKPRRKSRMSQVQYFTSMAAYYRNMAILAMAEERGEDYEYLRILYKEDWKRELGIAIYFGAAKNIPYGIKLTYEPDAEYEDIEAYSEDDPSQGCD